MFGRFESSSNSEYEMKGFRIVWTAVWIPKEDQSDYSYSGYYCQLIYSRLLINW